MKLISLITVLCYFLLAGDAISFDPAWYRQNDRIAQKSLSPVRCRRVKAEDVSTYSVAWFVANALEAKRPRPGACLFYTRGLTERARWYASKVDPSKTTIWDVWPGGYYNKKAMDSNPLRRIMQNTTEQRIYFSNMSKAFASLCQVSASVMDANVNANTKPCDVVNKLGIWFIEEFPTLREGGYFTKKVNEIEAISATDFTTFPYWVRGGVAAVRNRFERTKNKLVGCDDNDLDVDASRKMKKRAILASASHGWWEDGELPGDIEFNDYTLDNPSIVPSCAYEY